MKFTDIFIERPVLAVVISLLIFLFGLRSFQTLGVRQYPKTSAAYIRVTTSYPGASPALVKGFITTPLENSISQVDGIQYLESTSTQGTSSVGARLVLNYPNDKALTEITERVNAVRDQLPARSQNPTISMHTNNATDVGYFAFYSDVLPPNKVTDYVVRAVQPKFAAIQGVQNAELNGGKTFAMRIWLNPKKMAAFKIDGATVRQVLASNNYLSAVGQTKGQTTSLNINASTSLHSTKEFKDLVIKHVDGTQIKLKDIARVSLGAETYDSSASYNGRRATFVGIQVAPDANPLSVMQQVTKLYPQIKKEMPPGIKTKLVYDATKYMHASIAEVIKALGEALVIVIIVIFLFLGSLRSMIIPVIAMPLSLVGAGFLMQLMGFSINLLTLLAMVLAIGLVVDDAIIVVENIHRHIERGMESKAAALQGARELGLAVVAMSITLAAVYAPISFVTGVTGTLFTQFAFTVAGSVIISGIVALTLSPMLCSKFLRAGTGVGSRLVYYLDKVFEHLQKGYAKALHYMLDYRAVVAVMTVLILTSCYFLYSTSKHELAPEEDQGLIFVGVTASPNASFDEVRRWTRRVSKVLSTIPAADHRYVFTGEGPSGGGVNGGTAQIVLKPWGQRDKTQMQLEPIVQKKLDHIAGVQSVAFSRSSLPDNGGGLPIQVDVGTTKPPLQLYKVSQRLLHRAEQSGLLDFVENDLRYDKPQVELHIDRAKAAALGLTMQQVGADLASMLGGNYVNYFSIQGRSYKVIPQVKRQYRLNADQLKQYYINIPSGAKVPLSSMASIKTKVVPEQLKRYQQLNAADISGVPAPGVTVGQVIDWFQKEAPKILPNGYSLGYQGASLAYVQQSNVLVATFFFSLIVIFLVLAALFESFRDPFIILVSVPMSIAGALIFLSLGVASLNIYTEVGLITLIGLISKHGILIVRFANDLQAEGLGKREAVEQASRVRLRPILMTTLAMVFGVLPLIMATGPGAVSRFDIGLVIAAGLTIGTPLTLFVVPTMYMLFAHTVKPKEHTVQSTYTESA